MGWGDFFGGIGNILGWFSPEQREKSKRIQIERLEDEYRSLFETSNPTDRQRKRMSDILLRVKLLSQELRG